MDALLQFAAHIFDHWNFLMGILLMVEPLLDYYIAEYKTWADKYISRTKRTVIAVSVSAVCAVAACFFAFQDEYNQVQNLTGQKMTFRDLTKDQRNCLLSIFAARKTDFSTIVVSAVAAEEPQYYANSFVHLFQSVGINAISAGSATPIEGHQSDTGIIIGFIDPLHPSKVATEFETLLTSCGFKISSETYENPGYPADFDLFIAPSE